MDVVSGVYSLKLCCKSYLCCISLYNNVACCHLVDSKVYMLRMLVVPACVYNTHPELKLNCSMFAVWIQNAALNGAYASVNWQLYALVHFS